MKMICRVKGCVRTDPVIVKGKIVGASSSVIPSYTGAYEVIPIIRDDIILNTANKRMTGNVKVKKIPVYYVSNPQGGETVFIGGDLDYG